MTQKQFVLEAIEELSDKAPMDKILERVEFLSAVQKGLEQLDTCKCVPHKEVKRQVTAWGGNMMVCFVTPMEYLGFTRGREPLQKGVAQLNETEDTAFSFL